MFNGRINIWGNILLIATIFTLVNINIANIYFGLELAELLKKTSLVVVGICFFVGLSNATSNEKRFFVRSLPVKVFLILTAQLFVQWVIFSFAFEILVKILTAYFVVFAFFSSFFFFKFNFRARRFQVILTWILFIYLGSTILDFIGVLKSFQANRVLEYKYGFKVITGFSPNANNASLFLFNISLLLFLIDRSKLPIIGMLISILTFSRSAFLQVISFLFFTVRKKSTRILYILALVCLVGFNYKQFSEPIEQTILELDSKNKDWVYRVAFLNATGEVFKESPIIGVGFNRLSELPYWEADNFFFHNKYNLPRNIYGLEYGEVLTTSDTSITLIAEIGIVGVLMFAILFYDFNRLTRKHKLMKFNLVYIPIIFGVFQITGSVFNLSFFLPFWVLYAYLYRLDHFNSYNSFIINSIEK